MRNSQNNIREVRLTSSSDSYVVRGDDLPVLIGNVREAEIVCPSSNEYDLLCRLTNVGRCLAIETVEQRGEPLLVNGIYASAAILESGSTITIGGVEWSIEVEWSVGHERSAGTTIFPFSTSTSQLVRKELQAELTSA